MSVKEYLGDGVYVDYDGCNIVLTTENGFMVTNTIYFEVDFIKELSNYLERIKNNNKGKKT